MGVSLIAMRCRTSDRYRGAPRGVEVLAPLIAEALGLEPRFIGSTAEVREQSLRGGPARFAGLPARGRRAGRRCVRGRRRPRPARRRLRDLHHDAAGGRPRPARGEDPLARRARGLQLTRHHRQRLPGRHVPGRCDCGIWDAGFGESAPPERIVLAGVRDLDPDERVLLERSPATVIGASTVETLVAVKNALDGAPVYIHFDTDVIDPEHFPAAVPAPGGLHPDRLYDLIDSVLEDSRARRHRDHQLRRAGCRGGADRRDGDRDARARARP